MTKDEPTKLETFDDMLVALENLRGQVADLDAMAHSALQLLEHIPHIPRTDPQASQLTQSVEISTEARLQLGRLQTLVIATAKAAYAALHAMDVLLDQAQQMPLYKVPGNGHGSSHARERGPVYRVGDRVIRLVG